MSELSPRGPIGRADALRQRQELHKNSLFPKERLEKPENVHGSPESYGHAREPLFTRFTHDSTISREVAPEKVDNAFETIPAIVNTDFDCYTLGMENGEGESRKQAPGTSETLTDAVKTFYKSTRSKSNVHIVEHGEIIGKGLEGVVRRVRVVSDNEPNKSFPLVSKEFHKGESNIVAYDRIFRNYELTRAAGLPVPPTFIERGDQRGIFITDLSDGGNNVVLSLNEANIANARDLYAAKPELMGRFAHTQDLQSDAVTEQTDVLARKATDAGILLHSDTWFVVVKPDGAYDFVVGDFANVRKKEEIEKVRGNTLTREGLLSMNTDSLDYVKKRVGQEVQNYNPNLNET